MIVHACMRTGYAIPWQECIKTGRKERHIILIVAWYPTSSKAPMCQYLIYGTANMIYWHWPQIDYKLHWCKIFLVTMSNKPWKVVPNWIFEWSLFIRLDEGIFSFLAWPSYSIHSFMSSPKKSISLGKFFQVCFEGSICAKTQYSLFQDHEGKAATVLDPAMHPAMHPPRN